MKNILLIDGSNSNFGGVQRHISDLVKHDFFSKVRFTIARSQTGDCVRNYQSQNTEIKILHEKLNSLGAIKLLFKLCKENNFSAIHSHGAFAGLAGFILQIAFRIRHIHTIHGNPWEDQLKFKTLSYKTYLSTSIKNIAYKIALSFSKNISVSKIDMIEIKKTLIGKITDVDYIHNGISDIGSLSIERTPFTDNINLLAVCNLSPQKNISSLIDAMAILNESQSSFYLKILGDGPLKEELQQRILENHLSDYISLEGFVSDKKKYYEWADIIVMPSSWEGLPYSIIECLKESLFIVSTPANGLPELVINEKTGLLTSGFTSTDIAERILYASKLPFEKVKNIQNNAKEHFHKNFTLDKMARKTLGFYNAHIR